MNISRVFCLIFVFSVCRCLSQTTQLPIPIALLPFKNLSGDKNVDHWRYTLVFLLEDQLVEIKSLKVLPDTSIEFAFRTYGLGSSESLNQIQIRKLGEAIEARQVIWGSYQQKGGKWSLTVQMINVGTGKLSKPLTASSPDWFQAISEIRKGVLRQLGITPTREEEQRMDRPLTSSTQALEWLSRAYACTKKNISISNTAANLQQAVSLDPHFAAAQQALAHALLLQGKTDEALVLAKQAVTNRPNYAEAHVTLGTIYLVKNLMDLAEEEFGEAIRLDPGNDEPYSKMAEICFRQRKLEESVSSLKKAESLSPYDPLIHAQLGNGYLYFAERDKAMAELKMAEHYDTGDEPGVDESLAYGYQLLNEVPKAVEYYEKYIARAKEIGVNSSLLEHDEAELGYLKASLTTNFISASIPQTFTPLELERALKEKLTPEEYKLVVNPLASTPEIDKWAEQLAGNATNDMDKARRLFDGLAQHINIHQEMGGRTAIRTFKDWSNPKAGITCQDYTFLYMVMARHLGLKAYYVLVIQDYGGRYVNHACAGIFIDGKALLVDPAYRWFGVPHKDYEFVNDLRVIGFYLSASPDCAVGFKLIPDWPLPHFLAAVNFAYCGQLKQARELLQEGLKFDSTSWLALYAQAMVEWGDKNWDVVATHLQQCLKLNPNIPNLHYTLATVLWAQGNLKEAREEYRTFLRQDDYPQLAEKAREALASINETLSKTSEHNP